MLILYAQQIRATEEVKWMKPCNEDIPDIETLRTWMVEGPVGIYFADSPYARHTWARVCTT